MCILLINRKWNKDYNENSFLKPHWLLTYLKAKTYENYNFLKPDCLRTKIKPKTRIKIAVN